VRGILSDARAFAGGFERGNEEKMECGENILCLVGKRGETPQKIGSKKRKREGKPPDFGENIKSRRTLAGKISFRKFQIKRKMGV